MHAALLTLASRVFFSRVSKKEPQETQYKLSANDVDLFRLIQSRVLKTQRRLITQSLRGKCETFNEGYIAFDYGLQAAQRHLSQQNDNGKKKPLMTVYLGFLDRVDTSPFLRLIVKRTATNEVIMQCKLDGLL